MRRLFGSFALCALISGCHVAGRCDCDWSGYDNHGQIVATSAITPVSTAPATPAAQPAKESPKPLPK